MRLRRLIKGYGHCNFNLRVDKYVLSGNRRDIWITGGLVCGRANENYRSESCLDVTDAVSGGVSSHWEARMLQGSIMAASLAEPSLVRIDPVTLAALQDTGWYSVNLSRAQSLVWGEVVKAEILMPVLCLSIALTLMPAAMFIYWKCSSARVHAAVQAPYRLQLVTT
ncbi:hypothetical protein E1301_Tti005266 [Triplophysa tibetana]|uniref:Leishmanolysin-like peptidase n=1 Tax=Triplophysa tibetana TaxID=1572043 RepID=A0A5A9PQV3_9TELE|nr:hypothetical protein E1301_Tti005266 [Triplophysa tibetana]